MDFLKRVFADFSNHRCTTMAAALAYYTIFALPPLLYLLLLVVTFGLTTIYESDRAEQKAQGILERQAAQMIGNQAATEEISAILKNNRDMGGQWWKTLLSFAGILVGATGVVAALQDSLNRVWSVKPDPERSGVKDLIAKRLLSLAMIMGLGFLLLVSLIVSTVLSAVGEQLGQFLGIDDSVAHLTNYIVQVLVTLVIFTAILKFMPDAQVNWKDATFGAIITTLLFLVGRLLLQYYLSASNPGSQLGSAAASLAVILVWVYYSAIILLLGSEVTQVYACCYGGGIQPESKAVRVIESIEREGDVRELRACE